MALSISSTSIASTGSDRRRTLLVVALIAAIIVSLGTGCVQSPTGPGIIYMNVKGPLGPAGGTATPKVGKSCARVVLALFAWGDASIETAKRNGGITEVTTLDHTSFNLLGFGSFCTVVHGS
jgi:hypothetical protein